MVTEEYRYGEDTYGEDTQPLPPTANPLKTHLISQLIEERREQESGDLQNRNPLDESEPFQRLCLACRRGDVKAVQSLISFEKVNVNAVDRFDYPPLTLASLCGHYDVVKLLLENGAVCERDTFQGERCLYNALNNRIRSLLLQYDYTKSSDPLQPWAAGINALLARTPLDSTDISIHAFHSGSVVLNEFRLHKFLLAARSRYFQNKFQKSRTSQSSESGPDRPKNVRSLRMANTVDARALETAVKYMYLGEVTDINNQDVLKSIERLSRHLEIPGLWDMVMVSVARDPRKRRQTRTATIEKAQSDMDAFFREYVLGRKITVDSPEEANKIRVEQSNESFADVLLQAEEDPPLENGDGDGDGSDDTTRKGPVTVLYPVHKGMLRSEYFTTMFASGFLEGQKQHESDALSIIRVDASPAVLELALSFLYSEKTEIPLEYALDLLFLADQLFLDRLKQKCSHVICTAPSNDDLPYSIFDVVRAGWLCHVRRLEEFGAKYIAERLENYLPDPELAEVVAESAERIKERQETDSIEVLDDIRYYLGVRFRQRIGIEDDFAEMDEPDDDDGDNEGLHDAFFERQEQLQNELLARIDVLLEGLNLDA
ncbi:hypothetical protein BZA05DRAFT_458403 [Tricharina praecox]|uniref:uncharacterized protein n=1 Tax=Tricharina praecox TaxID=43433 RepID=UPI00221F1911|nr:uncharacterized protein BZA05DRAFT_458403 [Tricharina praecox]KAI5846067.1 hypothetical protein BZA05DRAFT_458403 [Tricharina praecox]